MGDVLSTAQSYACLLTLVWICILLWQGFKWAETRHPVAARFIAAALVGCIEGLFSRRRRRRW